MAVVKRITDLTDYTSVLPYASELFGVYQPLLGWKSKRIEARLKQGHERDREVILQRFIAAFGAVAGISIGDTGAVELNARPGALARGRLRPFDSVVLQRVSLNLPA